MPTDLELPTKFAFSISGGESDEGYKIEWKNRALWYRRTICGCALEAGTEVLPRPEAWKKFWQAVEGAGVWHWEKNYEYEGSVLDGTSWSLKLKHRGKNLNTKGDNAYPGCNEPDYSETCAFGQFIQALRELTGQKDIR